MIPQRFARPAGVISPSQTSSTDSTPRTRAYSELLHDREIEIISDLGDGLEHRTDQSIEVGHPITHPPQALAVPALDDEADQLVLDGAEPGRNHPTLVVQVARVEVALTVHAVPTAAGVCHSRCPACRVPSFRTR